MGLFVLEVGCRVSEVKNGGLKTVKNGPRVWAFCKIEFPGIQKPVQIFDQKWRFFKKCGNRGVGVIWWVGGLVLVFCGGCVDLLVCCLLVSFTAWCWGCVLVFSCGLWVGWRRSVYRY